MGLVNALFGTASEINAEELESEFTPILVNGEQITADHRSLQSGKRFIHIHTAQIDIS